MIPGKVLSARLVVYGLIFTYKLLVTKEVLVPNDVAHGRTEPYKKISTDTRCMLAPLEVDAVIQVVCDVSFVNNKLFELCWLAQID